MIAVIKAVFGKLTFQVDALLYIAIAVIGTMASANHFDADQRFWLGVVLVGLTAWKAKRSPGKAESVQSPS